MTLSYLARNVQSGLRSKARMLRNGYTMGGQKLWSEEETQVLWRYAGDYASMQRALPNRTAVAIERKCAKVGLPRRHIHLWTAGEITKLKRLYLHASAEEISAAFPHSTWENIRQAARYHGAVRARRLPYKPTGNPALDEVRKRCFEIRWTMGDLDKAARTGTYFRRCGWIGKKINHRALGRAIESLDGEVMAYWKAAE
jgi:hypothetical protein